MRQNWVDGRAIQTDTIAFAQIARGELKKMIKSIEDRQVAIQLAADAEWPHTDKANAPIRKGFGLPTCAPLKGYFPNQTPDLNGRRPEEIQGAFAVSDTRSSPVNSCGAVFETTRLESKSRWVS